MFTIKKHHVFLSVALLLFIFIAAFSVTAHAEQHVALDIDKAELIIDEMVPGTQVLSVDKTPVEGMLELVVISPAGKKGLIYMTEDGTYAFFGSFVNIGTQENITKTRFDEINTIEFSSIPLEDAIVLGQEKGAKHRVVVFDDPD